MFMVLLQVPATIPTTHALESEPVKSEMNGEVIIPIPSRRLWRWNVGMSIFHGILLIATCVIGNLELRVPVYGSSVKLRVGMGNSSAGWALAPDTDTRVGWMYMTSLVALFFGMSCGFHFGNAFIWRKYYEYALERAYAPFRWIEYSGSASVMILILSYTSGTLLSPMLVSLFALTMITMYFGHLHEVICRPKSLDEWECKNKLWRLQAHLLGYVPQCFAWGLIIAQFMDAGGKTTTDASGQTRQMPKFVYAIVFGEMAVFWSFGVVQLIVSLRPPSKYCQGEIAYMWLSLFAKGFLGIIVLGNVLILDNFTDMYENS